MARVRKDRGVVFGTSAMSSRNRPVMGGNPFQNASNVSSQFGSSLSRSPVYTGRQKSMRR
jgi:hypothetical protein